MTDVPRSRSEDSSFNGFTIHNVLPGIPSRNHRRGKTKAMYTSTLSNSSDEPDAVLDIDLTPPRLPSLDNQDSSFHWGQLGLGEPFESAIERSPRTPWTTEVFGAHDVLYDAMTPNRATSDSSADVHERSPGAGTMTGIDKVDAVHHEARVEPILAELQNHHKPTSIPHPSETSTAPPIHLHDMRISQQLRSFSQLSDRSDGTVSLGSSSLKLVPNESQISIDTKADQLRRDASWRGGNEPSAWGKVKSEAPVSRVSSSYGNETESPHFSPSQDYIDNSPVPSQPLVVVQNDGNDRTHHLKSKGMSRDSCGGEGLFKHPSTHCSVNSPQQRTLANGDTQNYRSVDFEDLGKHKEKFRSGLNLLHANVLRGLALGDSRGSTAAYDGPSDGNTELLGTGDRKPSQTSVSGNYDETAALWEKAWNAPPTARSRRHSSISGISHRSSLSIGRKSRISSNLKAEDPDDDQSKRRERSPSIGFKPIDTSHTFDRLDVPGRMSLSRSQTDVGSSNNQGPENDEGSFIRQSQSQPPPVDHEVAATRRATVQFLNPSLEPSGLPGITISDEGQQAEERLNVHERPRPKTRPNTPLGAWGRFPSETRNDRCLSAGAADLVTTRDFAPLGIKRSETNKGEALEPGSRKRKMSKVRSTSKALQQFFIKDLSSRIKPWTVGFRKAESGHRSSIAMSGTLEYPELELLPPAESGIRAELGGGVARKASVPDVISGRSGSIADDVLTNRLNDAGQPISSVTSSHYSSIRSQDNPFSQGQTHEARLQPGQKSASQLSLPNWSQDYGEFVTDPGSMRRRMTEEVSPFDGSATQTIHGLLFPPDLSSLGKLRMEIQCKSQSSPVLTLSCLDDDEHTKWAKLQKSRSEELLYHSI